LALVILSQAPVAPAEMGEAERQRQAKVLLDQALKKYDVADYEAAIESFKGAYALSPAPGLLFNIAQAYRLWGKGHCSDASRAYGSYLKGSPDAPNREKVEAHLKSLEKCAREEEKNAPPPPTPAPVVEAAKPEPLQPAPAPAIEPIVAPESTSVVVAPPSEPKPHRARWPSLLTGVGGLIIAGVGGGFYGVSGQQFSTFQNECASHDCAPSRWEPARTMEQVGVSLLLVGTAIAVAGAVWFLLVSGGE
jgi:tetratricopeptide (TPR) repeat protein